MFSLLHLFVYWKQFKI